ncbi:hypothetical protein FRC19_007860 [Serendipita sp. 401]|nr:hypothetical protein FRC19_007860 [Serendipita sp. 401]
MIGRNVFLALSALVLSMVINPANAQCANDACVAANSIYNKCKHSTTIAPNFKSCLCTPVFLVNYDRCLGGKVCAWDGNPDTLDDPCIDLYCAGTFDGGFDAQKFCSTGPITV